MSEPGDNVSRPREGVSRPREGVSQPREGVSQPRDDDPRARLAELGLQLPAVTPPVAAYVPAVWTGNHVYVSGQLPFVDGKLAATGKVGTGTVGTGTVGTEVTAEQATHLAARCALNALAAVDDLVGLESVVRIVKVVGFVASAEGFRGQPAVINGASELLVRVFGEAGRHARSAVGVAELPLGAPVEVEIIVEVAATRSATW
jgi:enamine deaminase RidA (YjgF/YER057c/UK114 family)